MSLMQTKHRAPAWWAGCSDRYSHTKVLPASSPGALGSGNIHATLCTRASPGFTAQQGVCLPLNPYITILSFLLQLSISLAQKQKASLISSASFPF